MPLGTPSCAWGIDEEGRKGSRIKQRQRGGRVMLVDLDFQTLWVDRGPFWVRNILTTLAREQNRHALSQGEWYGMVQLSVFSSDSGSFSKSVVLSPVIVL